MHESFLNVLHAELVDCPYQFNMIAEGVQQYVAASCHERAGIFKKYFSPRDFGEYWKVADKLIQLPCPLVENYLRPYVDRNQAAHSLIAYFIHSQEPVNPGTLAVASMYLA